LNHGPVPAKAGAVRNRFYISVLYRPLSHFYPASAEGKEDLSLLLTGSGVLQPWAKAL